MNLIVVSHQSSLDGIKKTFILFDVYYVLRRKLGDIVNVLANDKPNVCSPIVAILMFAQHKLCNNLCLGRVLANFNCCQFILIK